MKTNKTHEFIDTTKRLKMISDDYLWECNNSPTGHPYQHNLEYWKTLRSNLEEMQKQLEITLSNMQNNH